MNKKKISYCGKEMNELWWALHDLAGTTRTFRNVPYKDQQWTRVDDEVLDNAGKVLDKYEGRKQ